MEEDKKNEEKVETEKMDDQLVEEDKESKEVESETKEEPKTDAMEEDAKKIEEENKDEAAWLAEPFLNYSNAFVEKLLLCIPGLFTGIKEMEEDKKNEEKVETEKMDDQLVEEDKESKEVESETKEEPKTDAMEEDAKKIEEENKDEAAWLAEPFLNYSNAFVEKFSESKYWRLNCTEDDMRMVGSVLNVDSFYAFRDCSGNKEPALHRLVRSGATMAWNVLRFCMALRGLGSIMILLVLGVVGVTYYSVVLTVFGPAMFDGGLDSLAAIVLAMLLWSYFSVVFTDPGSVPANWRPALDEERGETYPLNGSEFYALHQNPSNQRIRYCRKCNQLKPPRCHHFCLWAVCAKDGPSLRVGCQLCWCIKLQIFPSFLVLNLAFALSVLGFLIMHISLVAANTTTIESDAQVHMYGCFDPSPCTVEAYEKKTAPKWRCDLGWKKNFEQVTAFAVHSYKRYWFIPAYSDEDLRRMAALQGLEYPSKPDLIHMRYYTAASVGGESVIPLASSCRNIMQSSIGL
ncbi:putative protein S-acyltransferase 14 [Hibiscus syriacus]|uniref:Palmitoyltransferase n=1 Tax=Hibiscus syriacus TaxID=106335 RepID=A0A6A2Y2M4_HIBSY|nr:putative protein S-acyltransferase 14 [Hibiscus syriacus]